MTCVKSNYDIARGICKRYMANYTETTTPPKNIKGGFFAIINTDNGDTWYNECKSFASTITRFRSNTGKMIASALTEARAKGAKLELWLFTRPDAFSPQQCENELYEADLLLDRKKPCIDGPGEMLVIRHRLTHNYFVVVNRSEPNHSTILAKFLYRLQRAGTEGRNQKLLDFVTAYADDILKQMNFDIRLICNVENNEDLWLHRQVFIDDQQYGECLNFQNVD